ncbi:hypothetical protein SKAU_G00169740 [Synaphobranchus kaupii]|uniref:Transcription factor Spi-C n=1 Tax=Synaphobranchus kaupii TaxID=118154 RepID=A0A9Q1IYG7_SYNKA|nr:hypothetical protein SKAU_G00169740 [Synaphobranchus kaupii]
MLPVLETVGYLQVPEPQDWHFKVDLDVIEEYLQENFGEAHQHPHSWNDEGPNGIETSYSGQFDCEWNHSLLASAKGHSNLEPLPPTWLNYSSMEWDHQPASSGSTDHPLSPPMDRTAEDVSDNLPLAPIRGRRKCRLYHFLYDMLQDPNMKSCIWWLHSTDGTFQFSSHHKERLAQMWGLRKGNRKTMTYQNMARALRNYAHSGEICKVKKKLTYRFNLSTLKRLQTDMERSGKGSAALVPPENIHF